MHEKNLFLRHYVIHEMKKKSDKTQFILQQLNKNYELLMGMCLTETKICSNSFPLYKTSPVP